VYLIIILIHLNFNCLFAKAIQELFPLDGKADSKRQNHPYMIP